VLSLAIVYQWLRAAQQLVAADLLIEPPFEGAFAFAALIEPPFEGAFAFAAFRFKFGVTAKPAGG
jgi:hypothetical protein